MRKENNDNFDKVELRFLNISELMIYTGLGRNKAINLGKESGACIKIGRRVIYDKRVIDSYLEMLLKKG